MRRATLTLVCCLLAAGALAQSSLIPLLVGGWKPERIPGTVMALRSDKGMTWTAATGKIATWADSSAAGNTPTVAEMLIFPSQSLPYWGKGAYASKGSWSTAQPYTIYALLYVDSPTSIMAASGYLFRGTTGPSYATRSVATGPGQVQLATNSAKNYGDGLIPPNQWVRLKLVVSGAASTVTVNGVTSAAQNTGTSALAGTLALGNTAASGSGGLSAWVPDYYIIAGTVSAADDAKMTSYLTARQALFPQVGRWSVLMADTKHNGFPGMVLAANDDLVVAYRKGTDHSTTRDGTIATLRSTDDGATWGAEAVILGPTAGVDYRDPNLMRTSADTLVLTYFKFTVATGLNEPFSVRSEDDGATWGAEVAIPYTGMDYAALSSPAVELASGDLIQLIYGDITGGATRRSAVAVRSTDDGASWAGGLVTVASAEALAYSHDEPAGIICADGSFLVMLRGTDNVIRQTRNTAGDAVAWSAVTTAWADGQSRVAMLRRPDNSIIAAYRTPVGLQILEMRKTTDNGATWSAPIQPVAQIVAMAYAALATDATGAIRMVYGSEWLTTTATIRIVTLGATEP